MAIKHMISNSTNIRHSIQSYGNGIDLNETEVKTNEVLQEVGTGASRDVNFGFDMITGNNGGMFLGKSAGLAYSWIIGSTALPVNKFFYANSSNGLNPISNVVDSYTPTGVTLGSAINLNTLNDNVMEFGFQTTHKKRQVYKGVKSVVFDCADNWDTLSYMGIRCVEFWKDDVLIPLTESDFSSYTNDNYSDNPVWDDKYVFITGLSKTGSWNDNSWLANAVTNNRIQVVFNTPIDFDRMVVINNHDDGAGFQAGVKNVKVYTSTDAITDTTYGAVIANSELIYDGIFLAYNDAEAIHEKTYCGVFWDYNPASGFFQFIHDGDGTGNTPIKNVTNKPVIWSNTKVHDLAYAYSTYSDKSGLNYVMKLNEAEAATYNATGFHEMSEDILNLGAPGNVNAEGSPHYTFGFVGDDLGHISPGMTGIEGSVVCKQVTGGGTFDSSIIDVAFVILKAIDGFDNWYFMSSEDNYASYMLINEPVVPVPSNTSAVVTSGSNVTISPDFGGDYLIIVVGKKGMMPSGQTININGTPMEPFVASIADGFSTDIGPKNITITENDIKVLGFSEDDGNYVLTVNGVGEYSLDNEPPAFDSSPGIMKGTAKIAIAEVIILDGTIIDVEVLPVGDTYETPWFPVEKNTKYKIPNNFKSSNVDFEIWWNSNPINEGKRHVTGQYYYDGSGMGAYKQITLLEFIIGTGDHFTFYSETSADKASSEGGYYKLIVNRGY